jgi:LPPG:FO 2-phospho-L-lactate transferase
MDVVALAGGVGAARFLRGLVRAVDPARLTVIANTGDDITLHGLHVSPDLDTITYTIGGAVHPEQGWGREDETTVVATELADRYGVDPWFTLGDRDLATHLIRTEALGRGEPLSSATARIAAAWGLPFTLLPMTDHQVATRVQTADGRDLHFQQWWVGEGAQPAVKSVRLNGAGEARPAPGVMDALLDADAVVLCPSNPVVSIGTILAVPGIRDLLGRKPVVGISPIIGGRVVRGMADRLLPAEGVEVSCVGVAAYYGDFLNAWVIDQTDAPLADRVRALGIDVAVTETVMRDVEVATDLARTALSMIS